MDQRTKPYFARLNFGVGVIVLIMGVMMACDCWGWFAFSSIFFIYPIKYGTRLLKISSIILIMIGSVAAVIQFREEVDVNATVQKLRQNR